MYTELTESVSLINRTCLQENEDLKAAKKEFNTLFVRQREEQDNLRKVGIIELLGHCKGGNFNIHIWAWFGYFIF